MIIVTLLTALALDAPLTAPERALTERCLAEGASEAECACGVQMMREELTPREIELAALVEPMLSNELDPEELQAAIQAAQAEGFTAAEIASTMQKIYQASEELVQSCTDAAGQPGPDGQADEAAPGQGVPEIE